MKRLRLINIALGMVAMLIILGIAALVILVTDIANPLFAQNPATETCTVEIHSYGEDPIIEQIVPGGHFIWWQLGPPEGDAPMK